MSYSLISQCGVCKEETECLDAVIIQGAIGTIHSVNYGVGYGKQRAHMAHKGGGTIELKCGNFESEK